MKKNMHDWCKKHNKEHLIEEWCEVLNQKEMKDIPRKSNKMYWWQCDRGHTWKDTFWNRVNNDTSCPLCSSSPSFFEMVIHFYISKYFKSNMNYHPRFLNGSEVDIYLPETKAKSNGKTYSRVGIEYDGARYHQDTEKDMRKNRICKKHGILIIRIRQKGCPKLPSDAECITVSFNSKNKYKKVADATRKILIRLGIENPRINFKEDLPEIKKKYELYTKRRL